MSALAQSRPVALCPRRDLRYRRIDVRARETMRGASFDAADPQLAPLLARCAAGDRAAFRRLYDLQAPRLHGVALRITRQTSLAADAVQDAFIQVWQNAGRFDPERGTVRPWLFGIATNLVAQHRRAEVRRFRALARTGVEPGAESHENRVLTAVSASRLRPHLAHAITLLSQQERDVVLLAASGELSHEEIATALAIPNGTVRSRLSRARKTLRAALAREGIPACE